jgi:hypothetical protein
MKDIFIDFETYYDREYSLRRMTTREYIMDSRFRATLLAVREGIDGEDRVLVGPEIADWVAAQDWANVRLTAHNAMFDAAVLAWRFKAVPRTLRCTRLIANCTVAHYVGGAALATLVAALGLGEKDTGALQAMEGVDPLLLPRDSAEWTRYVAYAAKDLDHCVELVRRLAWKVPPKHHAAMDVLLRGYVEGGLEMVPSMLLEAKMEAQALTTQRLAAAGVSDRRVLRSGESFASLLRSAGVEPPTKISARTGKPAYAFSKKDVEFVLLQEHEDPRVRVLVEARLNATSSIEETRAETMHRMVRGRSGLLLHVPLIYAGAHTGRFSGTDKLNMQNLPRRNKESKLRKAIVAPAGHVVVVADASQIEARILAWLAGCMELVEAFAQGRDVYAEFASKVYGREITKQTDPEARDLGKVGVLSLGYQTGADKLWQTLWLGGARIEHDFAARMVQTYRGGYTEIPRLWARLEQSIRAMLAGTRDQVGPVEFFKDGWRVMERSEPGAPAVEFDVRYPQLRETVEDSSYGLRRVFVYWRHRYKTWQGLYGGAVTENVVQHLAWMQIIDTIVRMEVEHQARRRGWRFVMQVHDELVYVVPEGEGDEALATLTAAMSAQPLWGRWKDYPVPLKAEGACAYSYGDAK